MRRLEELIREKCPEQTRMMKLKDIAKFHYGTGNTIPEIRGQIPVYGCNGIVGMTNQFNSENAPIIGHIGSAGSVIWGDGKHFVTYNGTICKANTSFITSRYLYYALQCLRLSERVKGNQPFLSISDFDKLEIPVPPIEVQQEIVSILDCFAELERELEQKLEREYDLRKTQYTYYRDLLLTPKPMQIKMMKLKDIATEIYRGNGIQRNNVTSEGIPCVRYGEIYTTYNTWFDKCVSHTKLEYVSSPRYFEHGDILFAITGENIEDIAKSVAYVGNEKCLAGSDIVVMKHNQNPKYLAYALSTYDARKQKGKSKTKGKVVHSNVKSIENIEIPVPPLEIQQRIVDVLDNFESICNDLSIGLPAEITSRKAQYEYYRDALLNYAETGIYRAEQSRAEQSRAEQSRAEQSRAEQSRADCTIRLIQYVFGYVQIELADLFDTRNGYTPSKNKKEYWTGGSIPWFRMEDLRTNGQVLNQALQTVTKEAVKGNVFPKDTILVSTTATIGEHALITVPALANQRFTALMLKPEYQGVTDMKYLFYHCFLLDEYCKDHLNEGNFASVDMRKFDQYCFTIPPIEKQKEIVHILDQFDDLCNGMISGLPAEIKKRKEQYEYYRNNLFSYFETSQP